MSAITQKPHSDQTHKCNNKHDNSETSFWSNSQIWWWQLGHYWQWSQQVNQVHSQKHESVRVSYQAGSAWRHLVFLILDEKGSIFITGNQRQEKRPCCKAFQQTQAPLPTEHTLHFLRWEKFLPGSDGELREQPLACSILPRCTNINEKPNTQFTSWCVEW